VDVSSTERVAAADMRHSKLSWSASGGLKHSVADDDELQ